MGGRSANCFGREVFPPKWNRGGNSSKKQERCETRKSEDFQRSASLGREKERNHMCSFSGVKQNGGRERESEEK